MNEEISNDICEEGDFMGVLAKNVNVAFEIKESKTSDFFKNTNKNAFKQAMERSNLHRKNKV